MKTTIRFTVSLALLSLLALSPFSAMAHESEKAPIISFIAPNPAAPGITVYVYGSNFDEFSFIAFDGDYGLTIYPTYQSATYLSFIVPAKTSIGTHTVQVGQKGSSLPNSNVVPLSVTENASVTILSPLANTSWAIGDTEVFKWSSTGFDSSTTGYIDLVGNGGTYRVAEVSNTGRYAWTVGKGMTALVPPGSYAVKVIIKGIGDITGPLTITGSLPPVDDRDPLPADIDTENQQGNCLDLQNNLRYRSRDKETNGEVSLLQDFLQANNYLNSEPSGFFGVLTLKSVKDFQEANKISPTGFVGPVTRTKIKSLTCKQ